MAEIKSFREYIEEKGVIEEKVYGDEFDEILGREKEPEEEPEVTKSVEKSEEEQDTGHNEESGKNNPPEDEKIVTPVYNKGFSYSPEGDTNVDQLNNLKIKLQTLRNTYNYLGKYLDIQQFKGITYKAPLSVDDAQKSAIPLDITNGISLVETRDKTLKKFNDNIEKWRETQRNVKRTDEIERLKWNRTAQKKYAEQLRGSDAPVPSNIKKNESDSEKQVEKEEVNSFVDLLDESINITKLRDALRTTSNFAKAAGQSVLNTAGNIKSALTNHPFATDSELTSSKRYNANRILTTAKWDKEGRRSDAEDETKVAGNFLNKNKAGIYGISSNFLENAYNDAKQRANALIRKKGIFVKIDLDRAESEINKYFKLKKVGNDLRYLDTISGLLKSAGDQLFGIGSDLKSIVADYKRGLDKLIREYEAGQLKAEKKMNSFDSLSAIEKYQKKEEKKEAKDTAKKERNELKAAEKKEKDDLKAAEKAKADEERQAAEASYNERKNYVSDDFKNLLRYNNVDKEKIIKACDLLLNKIRTLEKNKNIINDKKFWKTNNDGTPAIDIDEQKKGKAIALLALAQNVVNSDELKNLPKSERDNYFNKNFDKWFKNAENKYWNEGYSANDIVNVIKKGFEPRKKLSELAAEKAKKIAAKLPNDAKQPKDNEKSKNSLNKLNDWIYNKRKQIKAKPVAAKDFEDSEPASSSSQPTNIYAYALQKAKENK